MLGTAAPALQEGGRGGSRSGRRHQDEAGLEMGVCESSHTAEGLAIPHSHNT